jgi:phosphoenolpyruvate synthase/pyruvate phosphate dikinase
MENSMKKNILRLQEIDTHNNFLGKKTLNLKKCADWDFNVPEFVAIPSYATRELVGNEALRNKIAREAVEILRCDRYAVRSSALTEDGQDRSFAGKFSTKLDLSENDLSRGIYEIIKQAENFPDYDPDKLSLIIQEYIAADISGVAFTRNPSGDRDMNIEYGFCEGEKIVSGKIKPSRLSF